MAQVDYDWESRIQKEQQKISEIFSKLSGGRGISASEAKVMYIKKVRKLPMYGTTLFHVHNSKIFPSGHFLIAANSSGVQFLHPVTKEELHSPFYFSDLQRWEYTPKVFCFWSTKCDFLEEDHQGRHIVKYSLSTKQGWEISSTLHSYYKVLMQTDVTIGSSETSTAPSTRRRGSAEPAQIEYEAESDSGSDNDEQRRLASGGKDVEGATVTTFTPMHAHTNRPKKKPPPAVSQEAADGQPPPPPSEGLPDSSAISHRGGERVAPSPARSPRNSKGQVDLRASVGAADEGSPRGDEEQDRRSDRSDRHESASMLEMKAEYDRVRKELEKMKAVKTEFEELRKKHTLLENENKEVRKIVGDMYVSVDEDNQIREDYQKNYQAIIASLGTSQPRTAELMPKVYDAMVRMNDEDVRKEYIVQMEIILNDDPNVSEKIKGIAEGMSIKLGEMMDMPRHQRIAKLAKEEEERKKASENQAKQAGEQAKQAEKRKRLKAANKEAFAVVEAGLRTVAGIKPISLQGDQRRMAQRFQNRLELRMILMSEKELKMINPGQYKAMGTGGLKNEEIRALSHALSMAPDLLNTSADATRLASMLGKKIETLPEGVSSNYMPGATMGATVLAATTVGCSHPATTTPATCNHDPSHRHPSSPQGAVRLRPASPIRAHRPPSPLPCPLRTPSPAYPASSPCYPHLNPS